MVLEQTTENIQKALLAVIRENPDKACNIMDATVQVLVSQNKTNEKIQEIVLAVIQANSDEAFNIMCATVQALIVKNKTIEDIKEVVSPILDNNAIIDKQKLLNILIFNLISQYYYIKTTNKNIENLENYETYIIELYNQLNTQKPITQISEIKINYLIELMNKYFEITLSEVNGMSEHIVLFSANLYPNRLEGNIFKEDLNKIKTIDSDFFENLLSEHQKESITRGMFFDQLIKDGLLEEKDFGLPLQAENQNKQFKTLCVSYLNHSFLLIIDTSKSYKETIADTSSMVFVDSSNLIKYSVLPPNLKNLFSEINTVNMPYQENGTCWANVIAAIKVILENPNIKTIEDLKEGFVRTELEKPSPLEEEIILFLATNFLAKTPRLEEENYTEIGDSVSVPYSKLSMFNKPNLLLEALQTKLNILQQKETKLSAATERLSATTERVNQRTQKQCEDKTDINDIPMTFRVKIGKETSSNYVLYNSKKSDTIEMAKL